MKPTVVMAKATVDAKVTFVVAGGEPIDASRYDDIESGLIATGIPDWFALCAASGLKQMEENVGFPMDDVPGTVRMLANTLMRQGVPCYPPLPPGVDPDAPWTT